jgi:hypothetical protein
VRGREEQAARVIRTVCTTHADRTTAGTTTLQNPQIIVINIGDNITTLDFGNIIAISVTLL